MKRSILTFIISGIIVGTFLLCGWTSKQENEIAKVKWLMGTWQQKTARGSIYESWQQTNNNELAGKSYAVKGKDTMVFEQLLLVKEKTGLCYIPTVKGQNDDQPVRFPAKTVSADRLVFENPQHDFPQVISYTRINADSLVAEISGMRNGQLRKQTFPMKRVK